MAVGSGRPQALIRLICNYLCQEVFVRGRWLEGKGGNEEAMGENGHGAVVPPLAEVHRRIVEIVRSGTGSSDGRGGCDMAKLAPGYKKTYGEALDATKYARRV